MTRDEYLSKRMVDDGILYYYVPQFGWIRVVEEHAEDRLSRTDELAIGSDVRCDRMGTFFEQHMVEGPPGLS